MCSIVFCIAAILTAENRGVPKFEVGADPTRLVVVREIAPTEVAPVPDGDYPYTVGKSWLTLSVQPAAGAEPVPPLLGTYQLRGRQLSFLPQFALVRGVTYVARTYSGDGPFGKPLAETTYTVPAAEAKPPTTVAGVSPNLPTLPANVLKFYVSFTGPMREGREVLERIKLLDDRGKELGAPWRDLELWNADATRLSLFVHPGRIKQGVNLREDFGPVLTPGRKYTLVIGTDLLDAAGQPLAREFRYPFLATDELRRRIDVAAWSLAAAKSGEREPLVVTFDRPLDRHLALRALAVHAAAGQSLLGQGEVSPDGRRWSWTPVDRWSPGDFKLVVDPLLEDLCGNSPQRAFDHDLDAEQVDVLPPLLERTFSVE
ncbi:MAG: hypothetical protein JNL96_04965 [Planctomycetaceae bacterium]|nr:hypothetical protein [Planctomycetaceae bacterium]